MYELYSWYAWDFGRWVFVKDFPTKQDAKHFIEENKMSICVIKDGAGAVVITQRKAIGWRCGMCAPTFPVNPNSLHRPTVI